MVKKITAKKHYTDEQMKKKEGKFFDDTSFKIYKENVDIYSEEGELLVKFRKNVLTDKECEILFDTRGAATSSIRPSASGIPKGKSKYMTSISKSTGKPVIHLSSKNRVRSGIVGYYDTLSMFSSYTNKSGNKNKNLRCRKTAFTGNNMDKFKKCLPVFKKVSSLYKKLVPDRYKLQKQAISQINKDFVIKDTVFTTVTVNKNFRTALHTDHGDLEEGMGNILVVSDSDKYKGAYTMFPQYKFGIDVRNGDIAFMNVHKWHCNSKMESDKKDEVNRISFVFYLRKKMMMACPNMKLFRSKSKSKSKSKKRKSPKTKRKSIK